MSTTETGHVTMDLDGHVCTITVDNTAKKNAHTPAMLDQVAEFMTTCEENDDLRVCLYCAAGEHTTAGLDMPRCFGPTAERALQLGLVQEVHPFGRHDLRMRAHRPARHQEGRDGLHRRR